MYNTKACYGANSNSNIDISYILSTLALHLHIDRIYFSCNTITDKPEEVLFSVLEDNDYKCRSDWFAKSKAYNRIRHCRSIKTGIDVSILYERRKNYRYYPCMGVNIYRPDLDTVDWFDGVCNSFGFTTTLSHVELAIDFYPYECALHDFLWKHLFLKYNSGDSRFFDGEFGSFYVGNKSKNSKSLILYPKKIDNNNILRLEFRFNRAFLKGIGVALDCFEKINDIDLFKLFSFKELNRKKLLKHLIWKHKSRLSEYDDDDKCLLISHLGQIPGVYGGVMAESSRMKRIPYINNSQRFFEDIPEVNDAFFERLKGVKFI